jgi:hypothetical protein
MRKIPYSMHFRGRISSAIENSKSLRTTSTAASCTIRTLVGPDGLEADIRGSQGELAFLESELRVTGPESFRERGTIAFGHQNEHVLRFSTLGEGHLHTGPEPGTMAGTVSWKIDGGDGQFASASGLISSTFTFTESGEISDFHCGLILLPDL